MGFPVIPVLTSVLPLLVELAEDLFEKEPGSGSEKKHFVMEIIELILGELEERQKLPLFGFLSKNVILRVVSLLVDKYAQKLFPNPEKQLA